MDRGNVYILFFCNKLLSIIRYSVDVQIKSWV